MPHAYSQLNAHAWQQQQVANIWQYVATWQAMGGTGYPPYVGMVPPAGQYGAAMMEMPQPNMQQNFQQETSSGTHAPVRTGRQETGFEEQGQERSQRDRQGNEEEGEDEEYLSRAVAVVREQVIDENTDVDARRHLGKRKVRGDGIGGGQTPLVPQIDGVDLAEEELRYRDIPSGVETLAEGEEGTEQFLLPFVCALHAQDVFVLGLKKQDNMMVLPAIPLAGLGSADLITSAVSRLYSDRFAFQIFPEDMMPKLVVNSTGGRRLRFSIPLIDARIPTKVWHEIENVGMDCLLLNNFTAGDSSILDFVVVQSGIPAAFLRNLNEKLPARRNLNSVYLAKCLIKRWLEQAQQSQGEDGHIQQSANSGRVNG
ncbi:hypothetical protein CBR_g46436 [Chara braunii]|uniref:Uncharacterized protein n=1 Tax=Chara braunii TaxID=69332 RepID=A0A388M0H1_CHABU|nr:hypothetical protein CBR_g46436 [Chara braunii]|eukprot:GBG88067.1 hypothetical protein CBR_g46436 [Chara braunii]